VVEEEAAAAVVVVVWWWQWRPVACPFRSVSILFTSSM